MRDLFNGCKIVLRDYRHPGLDSMDTHLVEFPRDRYFLSPAQHDARCLLAVSQGNVVKDCLFLELESRNNFRIEVEAARSEEHTSELQSPCNLVCRLLLEKKKKKNNNNTN